MDGLGTVESPYVITSFEELQSINDNLSAHYVLGNDIDADGYTHNAPYDFTGTFDGQGHIIYNLYIGGVGNSRGLFGRLLSTGVVRDVGLINANINGGWYTGGIVGWVQSGCLVERCFVTGSVTSSVTVVGGVVGFNQGGIIQDCYNFATVVGNGDSRIAGVVGRQQGTARRLFNAGHVSSLTDWIPPAVADVNVTSDCYWDSEVSGTSYDNTGAVGKTTAEMKTQSTYTDWDFINIWGMDSAINDGYPHLLVFGYEEEPPVGDDKTGTAIVSGGGSVAVKGQKKIDGSILTVSNGMVTVTDQKFVDELVIEQRVGLDEWEPLDIAPAESGELLLDGPFQEGETYSYRIKRVQGDLESAWAEASIVYTATQAKDGFAVISGGGPIVSKGQKNSSCATSVSTKGKAVVVGRAVESVKGSAVVAESGDVVLAGQKGISDKAVVSAGGNIFVEGTPIELVQGVVEVSVEGATVISAGEKRVKAPPIGVTGLPQVGISGFKQSASEVGIVGQGLVVVSGVPRDIISGKAHISDGGLIDVKGCKEALGDALVSASGLVAVDGVSGEVGSGIAFISGGGNTVVVGEKGVSEQAFLSGNGNVAIASLTTRGSILGEVVVDGGGWLETSVSKEIFFDVLMTTSASVETVGAKQSAESVDIHGGGSIAVEVSAAESRSGKAVVSGGGSASCGGQKVVGGLANVVGCPDILVAKGLKGTSRDDVCVSGRGDVVAVGLSGEGLEGTAGVFGGGLVATDGQACFIGKIRISARGRVESRGDKGSLVLANVAGSGHPVVEFVAARFGDTIVIGQGKCLGFVSKGATSSVQVSSVALVDVTSIAAERVFRIETSMEDFSQGILVGVVVLEDGTVRLDTKT